MPKHRGTVYTVIRERRVWPRPGIVNVYEFSAVVGTYATVMRAEEVAGAMLQGIIDGGALPGEFIFSVKASTWYSE